MLSVWSENPSLIDFLSAHRMRFTAIRPQGVGSRVSAQQTGANLGHQALGPVCHRGNRKRIFQLSPLARCVFTLIVRPAVSGGREYRQKSRRGAGATIKNK